MTSARGIHATGYLKAGILYDDFGTNIALTNVDLSNSSTYWELTRVYTGMHQ